MSYEINKEKCIGCGLCTIDCAGGTELTEDGKAKITDQKKLEDCGGEKVCPYGAILRRAQDGSKDGERSRTIEKVKEEKQND